MALTQIGKEGITGISNSANANAITIDSGENVALSGTLGVTGVVTANAGVKVDNITIDGTEIDLSSGDFTLDVAGEIVFDADGGNFFFNDASTSIGRLRNVSSDFVISSEVQDKDLIFKGNDGGSVITALTLDMSGGGAATFNSTIASTGINFSGDTAINNTVDTAYNIRSSSGTGTHYFGANRTGFSGGVDIARLGSTGTVFNESGADLDFRVEGDNDTHALFVQAGSDHVGINNSSPNSSFAGADNLVIGGGSGHTGMTILSGTSSRSSIEFSDGTGSDATKTAGGIRYYHDSNYMRFNTNGGTERMRIDATGRVMIGTTTEGVAGADELTVGTTTAGNGITIRSASNSSGALFFSDGTSGGAEYDGGFEYNHNSQFMRFISGASERMRLDTSGLMINTTTAFNGLNGRGDIVVGNGSSNGGMTIFTGSSNQGAIAFADGTSGDQAYRGMVEYDQNTDSMAFKTAVSERMRIDSNGYVNIATTSRSPELSHPGLTLRADVQGGFPTLLSMINQPGTGGTMGARIHMGYSSDYGSAIEFFGNPFNARAGGLRVRSLVGSGQSNITMQIGTDGAFNVQGVFSQTTGAGTNMNVGGDGHIKRSSSSLRYKNTINDATHSLTELLTLRPVTYKGNNDGDTVFGGLIAEEVHDAGLTEFVQYDADNRPDGLAYGNMVSLCIKAIQELKAENTALANRITELEKK